MLGTLLEGGLAAGTGTTSSGARSRHGRDVESQSVRESLDTPGVTPQEPCGGTEELQARGRGEDGRSGGV